MSKQFRVYLLPSDIHSVVAELRARVGIKIIEETAPTSAPVELESPIRNRSGWIKTKDAVSVRCYLVPPKDAALRMSFYPKQSNWQINHGSEVIEFSGCDYGGGILLSGRFYFQNDILIDNTLWRKRGEFTNWADSVFRGIKKMLHRSKALEAYMGEGTERFIADGGRLVSSMKSNGEPVYADML